MSLTARLKHNRSFRIGSCRVNRPAGSTVTIKQVDRRSGNLLIDFGSYADWFHSSILRELEVKGERHG